MDTDTLEQLNALRTRWVFFRDANRPLQASVCLDSIDNLLDAINEATCALDEECVCLDAEDG